MRRFHVLDLALAAMFVALMAIGANIVSWAPFLQVAGIPLSMQPFFAILAGLLLGSRLGALSMTVYMLVGVAGAPIFANFKAGFGALLDPTGGFIIAFIIVAYVSGKLVEQKEKTNIHYICYCLFHRNYFNLYNRYYLHVRGSQSLYGR